jgi:hypothetical protein
MQFKVAAASICLFIALPTYPQSKSEEKNADRAQVVSNGEITKVDAKKKTLQVKELLPPASTGRSRTDDGGTRGGRGTTGGGGRRRSGGVGFPGGGRGGGGGGYPGGPGGGGGTTQQAKEYKVFITKDTVMKLAETNIEFSDLHVGDRVTISGFPKGSKGDVEAATITRTFQ